MFVGLSHEDYTVVSRDARARHDAYDLALAVCHADGVTNEAETKYLTTLRTVLRLSDTSVAQDARTAGALASAPVTGASVAGAGASAEDMILQT